MNNIAVLRDLLERVRAAKGADRELDCVIWAEMHDRDARYESGKMLAKSRRPPHDDCMLGFVDPGRVSRNFYRASNYDPPVPEYTRSLDDAVALIERVLPGWAWKTGTCSVSDDAWVAPDCNGQDAHLLQHRLFDEGFDIDRRPSGNIPLALIEALLSAIIALAERAGNGESGG